MTLQSTDTVRARPSPLPDGWAVFTVDSSVRMGRTNDPMPTHVAGIGDTHEEAIADAVESSDYTAEEAAALPAHPITARLRAAVERGEVEDFAEIEEDGLMGTGDEEAEIHG